MRRKALPPKVRDRIEMVTLSDAGWSAPRIAAHLGYCGQTVRDLLRDFLARGTEALYPFRTGPGPRRRRVATGSPRSCGGCSPRTAPGPAGSSAEALAERGIALGPRQVRRHLKRIEAGYRRTASTLKHKQDPAKAERAGRVLANLKAKAAAGRLKLYYLDECGFSPTLPTGYSWTLPGQRKLVRYEAPQGRRVNALAAYRPYGRSPRLEVFTAERTWDSYDLLGLPQGAAVVEGARGWWCWTTPASTPARSSAGPGGAGRLGDLPVLPAAVQPGAERRSRRTKQTPPQATGGAAATGAGYHRRRRRCLSWPRGADSA